MGKAFWPVLCCHCGEFGWYGTLLFLAWGQEELASQGQKATAMAMAGEGRDRMAGTSDDRFCIHLFIYSSSLAFVCLRNVSPSYQDHPPASTNSAEGLASTARDQRTDPAPSSNR